MDTSGCNTVKKRGNRPKVMKALEQAHEKCCQAGHESHSEGTWKCSELAKVSHFLLGF